MVDGQLFIDDDRYSRLRLIAWWDQERLRRAQVLVVGAGALGNEVLKNLALLGTGHVVVVDCDHVDLSNLSRSVLFRPQDRGQPKAVVAARAVRDLNPDVRVTALPENVLTGVGLGWFRDADVVIGCLDNREARLWVNRACWKLSKPWIDGGIQELNGVVQVFTPPDKACYECGMTEMDYRLIQLRHSCPLLRREDLLSGKVSTAPTIAAVIGGLQTQEALKLLHGLPVAGGEALVFNGAANTSYRTQLPYREDCLSHDPLPPLVELPLSAGRDTAQQLFAAAREYLPTGALRLLLDRDLVVSLECRRCNTTVPVLRALPLVGVHDGLCATCGDWARPVLVHAVAAESELAGERLATLGVPPYDIVRVAGKSQEHAFLLAADRPPTPEPLFSVDRPPGGRND
jgi:adenylyltransferase/sulfurtransferase